MKGTNLHDKESELERRETEENNMMEEVEDKHLMKRKELLIVHLLKRFLENFPYLMLHLLVK